jgi:hypothetical protein
MIEGLRNPALIVHAFFPADHVLSKTHPPTRSAVQSMWKRAWDAGYTKPIGHWAIADVIPLPDQDTYPDSLTVLAAAEKPTSGGFRQLLVYQLHDVVGVSAVEAITGTPAWEQFDDGWLVGQDLSRADLIGAAVLYLGLDVGGRLIGDRPEWGPSWQPTDKLRVWELSGPGTSLPGARRFPAARRLLAAAGPADEPTLDEWFWGRSGPGLPPFTRYLLHAAKLRHQREVLRRELPGLRDTVENADRLCAALDEALRGEDVPLERVLLASRGLTQLHTSQRGLIAQLADVRSMIRTIQIAQRNMDSVVPADRAAAVDREIGRWTLEQLQAEETYLSSAQLKAAELSRLTTTTVSTRLEERNANLALFRTAVLGSVLMALAAIQSFQFTVPLPGRLQPPTIFLLAAFALVLPSAVVRWLRGATYDPKWARIDVLFAAVAGSAVGWFVTSLISWSLTASRFAWDWSEVITVGAAAVSALLGGALAARRLRKLRQAP